MAEYYYNLETHEVEVGKLSDARKRMGPYATREEALNAMQRARERNREWESEDRRWSEYEDEDEQ